MGTSKVRRMALRLTAAASLVWLGGAQGQPSFPGNCDELGPGWQTMQVSGQTSSTYTAEGGQSCNLAPCEGGIFVCFNPQQNCYLAAATAPFESIIPFTTAPLGSDLGIASAGACGDHPNNTGKSFNVRLSSTDPGSGCLNRLIVNEGFFAGGQLVEDEKGPAVLIESNPPVLVDQFLGVDSLDIPGFHGNSSFKVHVPLMDGMSGMAGAITVRNQSTGQLIGGGSVNNTCGARLSAPVKAIPTLPQYGMMLLTGALLFAAVRITRRRLSA
jgi:hypothetical protein